MNSGLADFSSLPVPGVIEKFRIFSGGRFFENESFRHAQWVVDRFGHWWVIPRRKKMRVCPSCEEINDLTSRHCSGCGGLLWKEHFTEKAVLDNGKINRRLVVTIFDHRGEIVPEGNNGSIEEVRRIMEEKTFPYLEAEDLEPLGMELVSAERKGFDPVMGYFFT